MPRDDCASIYAPCKDQRPKTKDLPAAALCEAGVAVDRPSEIRREAENRIAAAVCADGGVLTFRAPTGVGRARSFPSRRAPFLRCVVSVTTPLDRCGGRCRVALVGRAIRVARVAASTKRELLLIDQVDDVARSPERPAGGTVDRC